jgi:hypothetical protein
VFQDSWLFPIALTFIGIAVIYLRVPWQKNEAAITRGGYFSSYRGDYLTGKLGLYRRPR